MPETATPTRTENPTAAFARQAREMESKIKSERLPKPASPPPPPPPADNPPPKDETKAPADVPKQPSEEPKAPAQDKAPTHQETASKEPSSAKEATPEREPPRSSKQWDDYKAADRARYDAIAKERDTIKAQVDAILKERDELKAQFSKVANVKPEDVDAYKRRIDDLTKELSAANLERLPEFHNHYKSKIEKAITDAKAVVGPELAPQLESLMRLPESQYRRQQIKSLIEGLDEFDRGDVRDLCKAVAIAQSERDSEIEKARVNPEDYWARVESVKREKEAQERKALESAIEDTVYKFPESDALKPIWDDEIGQLTKNVVAKGIRTPEDAATMATLVAKGMGYHKMLQLLSKQQEEFAAKEAAWAKEKEELASQAKSLQAAQPSLSTSTATASADAPTEDAFPKDATPRQITEWLQRRTARNLASASSKWASGG